MNQPRIPVWSKQKMLMTALQIGCVVLIISVILIMVANIDLHATKETQKAERMFKYLSYAEMTIQQKLLNGDSSYSHNSDFIPPEELSTDYVEFRGEHGYFEDESRYLRLDMFHPDGIFKGPLFYWENGNVWLLISRGSDLDLDLNEENLSGQNLESPEEIRTSEYFSDQSYDPSNGALSSGDLFVFGSMNVAE